MEPVTTALWFITFTRKRNLDGAKALANAYTAAGKTAHFGGFPDWTHNQVHWALAKTRHVYE